MAKAKKEQASEETEADAPAEEKRDDVIRKKDIYDHVTVATGLRKREVREAVDATLAYFHSTLSDGKSLQIPPLGKVRVIDKSKGEKENILYKVILQKPKVDDEAPAEAAE